MKKLERIRKVIEEWDQGDLNSSNTALKIKKILGKKPKLFAIPHDKTLAGDNTFYCPDDKVEYKEGQGIREVRQALHERRVKLDTGEIDHEGKPTDRSISPQELRMVIDETNETYTSQVEGAWVVTEDTIELLYEIWEALDPGNDSSTYRANYLAKYMAKKFAVKTLGKKAD